MIAWLDTTAGVAGDMVLAALLDAGADLRAVQAAVDAVAPDSVRLATRTVQRQGQRAVKLDVEVLADDPPHRRWADIEENLRRAPLHERTRDLALRTFSLLADAEGHVHGVDPATVHFHEVGALDSIADVVGACEALRLLGVERVVGTAVAVGSGHVHVAHGMMPVPVPAVAQLALGWPTTSGELPAGADVHTHADGTTHSHADGSGVHTHADGSGVHTHAGGMRRLGELATPTGMALVRAWADEWSGQPAMVTRAIGVGAGTKDTEGRPNVVRVVIGEPAPAASRVSGRAEESAVVELAANVDDLDPRLWPGVIETLGGAGALDAWLIPIVMKKGRPAHTLTVLARASDADALAALMLASAPTFGVRHGPSQHRTVLERTWQTVTLDHVEVRIKIGSLDGVIVRVTPEFDDVATGARTTNRSELDLMRAAEAAAAEAGWTPGAPFPA